MPALTEWWREGIGRWLDAYELALVLELWACVGRGAAKSTALYKLATFFTLFGPFAVPPGERHFAIVLSRLKEEAAKGLEIIGAWLTLLDVAHHPAGDVIELEDLPRGIRVVAASVAATSGWRSFFVGRDERGKWQIAGVDERDGDEIDTSSAAMTATHARAPIVTLGSAWLTLGAFHETIAAGSTKTRIVLGPTPTWIAAPHITEEDCRRKEPDPRKFAREYAAIATDAHDEAMYPAELVTRSQRANAGDVAFEKGVPYTAAMDPSLGRNAFTFVIAGARLVDGESKASVVLHREWRAPRGSTLDLAAVLASIAAHCASYGIDEVRTDQFHGESLALLADKMRLGIRVLVDKPTAAERLARYEGLLVRFLDEAIELPRDSVVRGDLLAVRRRVTKTSEAFTIHMATTADGRHADFAPAIALALERIVLEDAIPGWVHAMGDFVRGGTPQPKPVTVTTDAIGESRARGAGDFVGMSARWLRGTPTIHFSDNASAAFRDAVTKARASSLQG